MMDRQDIDLCVVAGPGRTPRGGAGPRRTRRCGAATRAPAAAAAATTTETGRYTRTTATLMSSHLVLRTSNITRIQR